MDHSSRFTIAVAIPYLNAKPHIGQALEYVYADVLRRYQLSVHRDTFLIMGADEHGQKIARSAAEKNETPQAYVDGLVASFTQLHSALEIEYDTFVRTSSQEHKAIAQALWQKVSDNGFIEKREYEGLYCVGCEEYKTEEQLVDGVCPDHKTAPEHVHETNYFFRLSAFQSQLQEYFDVHPDFVIPQEKRNEMRALLDRGLFDVSISRDITRLSWGVPVPNDESQVMYVWFDALANYLTGAGVTAEAILSGNLNTDQWPVDVIVIGKDINRFHSLLFAGMLLAAELPLPKQIAVHGHITVDGQKMSKTIGNVINPFDLIEQFGAEEVRYLLMAEIPFATDGDISLPKLHERYTADLVNGVGNLLNRTTNLIEKYFDGESLANFSSQEKNSIDANIFVQQYYAAFERMDFHVAIRAINAIVSAWDARLAETEPWKILKGEDEQARAEAKNDLYFALRDLGVIATLLKPFMPNKAQAIARIVSAERIQKPTEPLFPRITLNQES